MRLRIWSFFFIAFGVMGSWRHCKSFDSRVVFGGFQAYTWVDVMICRTVTCCLLQFIFLVLLYDRCGGVFFILLYYSYTRY